MNSWKRVAASALLTGLLAACGQHSDTPVSPSASGSTDGNAAADGSTLKATTPGVVSPSGGSQITDPVVLTASKAVGKFSSITPSYQFQIRSGSTVVHDTGVIDGVSAGDNVTFTVPSAALTPDTDYTWRVRASFQGAVGSWSADGAFKSPVGAFIRGNELRDPLVIGRSVGTIVGPTQFTADGLKLLAHESHVTYQLPTTLTAGEFGLMVKGADEGTEGDKSKIFSMQQGFGDITTNAYRFTGELRGANYGGGPGTVSCRMIAGDGISRDCDPRRTFNFDSTRWYFWRVSWNIGGSFTMEVRKDGPTGSMLTSWTIGLGGRTYKPNPHILYLGAPFGRAGALDATLPGGTYKNVYAGPGPRPSFPGE